jgi:hypothetical protein
MIPVPSPFAYEGLLYLDGGLMCSLFVVRPGASGDVSLGKEQTSNDYVTWTAARAGTYLPTPVAYEGGLYVLSEKGILSRFDTKTGKLTYKERIDQEGGLHVLAVGLQRQDLLPERGRQDIRDCCWRDFQTASCQFA